MNPIIYSTILSFLIITTAVVFSYFDMALKNLRQLSNRHEGFPQTLQEKSVRLIKL